VALQKQQPRLDPKRLVFIDETSLYGRAPRVSGRSKRYRMRTGKPPLHRVGLISGGNAEIREGLNEGDMLVAPWGESSASTLPGQGFVS